jgi:high-affinity nickel-transport protein
MLGEGRTGCHTSCRSWIWSVVNAANDNFGALGYAVIAIFVVSLLISLVVYRVMGYDKLNALGSSGKA